MYQILQWTPFPNKFQPMPLWQLQKAEFDLGLCKKHYHDCAVLKDGELFYRRAEARAIVSFWQAKYPFADFQLKCRNGEFE